MKKLTLVLSTVLLLSSTSAFARSKSSKVMKANLGNASDCELMVGVLNKIASADKKLRVKASCTDNILTSQWRVSYIATPTQKFKYRLGYEARKGTIEKWRKCDKIGKLMGKMSGLNFSFNAQCFGTRHLEERKKGRYDTEYYIHGHWYNIKGEISLK